MFKCIATVVRRSRALSILVMATTLSVPAISLAQAAPVDHSTHKPATAPGTLSLVDQVAELRDKVAKLESALQHKQMGADSMSMPGKPMPPMGAPKPAMAPMGNMPMGGGKGNGAAGGMGMMQGMMGGEMGGMGSMAGGGSMPAGGAMPAGGGMSGMDGGMMSMMGMPPAGGMGGMAMPTALPGFPGASHIYHIGSTGFFLDHEGHITLALQQKTALNSIKEKALLDKASKQREIDAAEQELWVLTASDQPDGTKVETKVRDIEKLRGDQRLGLVRAVGEAAKVLNDPQRQSLLGQQPPQTQTSPSSPAGGAMPPM